MEGLAAVTTMCVPSMKVFLMNKYFSEMEKNWQKGDLVYGKFNLSFYYTKRDNPLLQIIDLLM